MSGNKKPLTTNNMYGNYGKSISPNISQDISNQKQRLRVQLTAEERGFFSSLFQIADKNGKGKLVGKEAADFLMKSGLHKETLKHIWVISAQTDNQSLERDEFYIALRLVALAQNNMEFSEESIRLNHPIPPLPKFDLKNNNATSINKSTDGLNVLQSNNNMSPNFSNNIVITESDPFYLTEADLQKYTALFNKNKDMENKMSINKAYQMWTTGGVSMETLKKIFLIVPFSDKTCLNFNEFKVIFHLIYKSLQYEIPTNLPNSLKKIFYPDAERADLNNKNTLQSSKEINFGEKLGLDLNLAKSKEKKENVIETNQNNLFVNSNINQTPNNNMLLNTNKSVDMETLLMNEFNLKNNPPVVNSMNTMNVLNYSQDKNILQYSANNIQTINNLSNNISEKFNNVYTEKIVENKFLEQILEEEKRLLNHFREQVENIYTNINQINQRNLSIKNQIIELKRQTEIEKENLSKGLQELNQRTIEMLRNQEELNNIMNEKVELSKRAIQLVNNSPNQFGMATLRNNIENNSNNFNLFENNSDNNSSDPINKNQNQFSKIKNKLDIDLHNFNDNQNLSKVTKPKEEKLTAIDNIPARYPTNSLNNSAQNPNLPDNNKQFNNSKELVNNLNFEPILNTRITFDENKLANNQLSNKSSPFLDYPKLSNADGGSTVSNPNKVGDLSNKINQPQFNFENNDLNRENFETEKRNKNQQETNKENNQKNVNSNNNYDTNGFDFTGFNDVKVDSFKEFADRKGDDFFKNQADFQANWDDF